jgi:hypothetical protein
MKKKQSEKPAIPTDPVVRIYNDVFYLLHYLRTMAPCKLNPPSAYENGSDGEIHWTKPTVDRCWKEFDLFMRLYLQTIQAFAPKLREIRALRMDPIVSDAIFRTFADQQREAAYLDDAIQFIEKGFHLFRRLFEEGGYVEERTEKVFYHQAAVCSRIWRDHDYCLSEIAALEAGLKWELATIHNRRSPVQSTFYQGSKEWENLVHSLSKPKTPDPEQEKTNKKYLRFLEEYEAWQEKKRKDTGRKVRLNSSDWLSDKSTWKTTVREFFDELCGIKDGSEAEIVENAIRNARRIRKESEIQES